MCHCCLSLSDSVNGVRTILNRAEGEGLLLLQSRLAQKIEGDVVYAGDGSDYVFSSCEIVMMKGVVRCVGMDVLRGEALCVCGYVEGWVK